MASKRTIQAWIGIGFLVAGVATVLIVCSWMGTKREHRFDPEIMAAARKYKIEPALVKAVIWQESKFNPNAQGKAGEIPCGGSSTSAALAAKFIIQFLCICKSASPLFLIAEHCLLRKPWRRRLSAFLYMRN